ncbi:MAG: PAS domain-containing protein, partial [Planctomycetota bacterium]
MKDKNNDQFKNEVTDNIEVLRISEERFRSLVETTSDWIWEVDTNGVYTYVSPKIRDILGYEPEEVLGKTPFDLMPQDEASRISDIFSSIVASQEPFRELENINVHKDGHMVTLETSGNPFFDEMGKLLGYRGIDRDITKRKKTEDALKKSENELRSMYDAITDFLTIISPDYGILSTNRVVEKRFGKNLVGKKCYEVYQARNDICPDCPTKKAIETKKP